MTNNILLVAFQFPPMSGSSGLLRVLKFCRHLPEFGWTPTVITANPRMYEETNERQLDLIPPGLEIVRASGLDTRRHLSVRGRYLRFLAIPDAWVSWSVGAVASALRVMRQKKIDVVFTTFPVATAILIGLILHYMKGIPWVVDFRDSMTEDNYPRNPATWRTWRWLEKQAIRRASLILFTARSAIRMYRKRYPELLEQKCLLLPNGYDEEDFAHLPLSLREPSQPVRPLRLLHSGLVYPEERDPWPFFRALARLHKEGRISPETLNVNLRAPGFEETYAAAIRDLDLLGIVHLLPRIPYTQALQECSDVDALLVMQAANCDHQIPAKAYEYLRIGKPILALTTQTGDTAALLKETGGATIADLANEQEIAEVLPAFLNAVRSGAHSSPDPIRVRQYARQNQAKVLADALAVLCQQTGFVREYALGEDSNSAAISSEVKPARVSKE